MAERLNHELRTPLTELVGVSDLFRIVGPGDSDAKVRSRLMGILDCSVNRLRHTVEMLLLYTEMSSRGWRPARATGVNDGASVAEMTIDVIEELRSHHSRWNDLVFTVFADAYSSLEPDHLRLVLRELIDNALKFSAAGQEVAVTVRRHASTVSVRIDDRGRGMSPCQIALIGPFQQFDAAEYAQQGLGLGLYVSRIIAQAYGGNLEIRPGAVRGLSVSAVFPVRGD
jgi:signal transduction histidine kinase